MKASKRIVVLLAILTASILPAAAIADNTVLLGDVDGNGRVTPRDRTVLARYLAQWKNYGEDSINYDAADVNGDGKVNAKDRTILARHLADWKGYETLPWEETNGILRLDTPESQGAANLQKRARQLVQLQYTFAADLIHYRNSQGEIMREYLAGSTSKGMLYSSTRDEELFVPQSVSFHTFMTALQNPNSYFYTRQSRVSAQKLYYGAVCSTFVDYCYGIDYSIPTTYMLEEMEGMTLNEDQSASGLKIGDLISKRGKHVAVVTDILRNQTTGAVVKVYLSEAGLPVCRTRGHSPEEFQRNFLDLGFRCFRWSNLDSIGYESSPWINVDEETEKPVYSTHLSPRRGDKANWRAGETVEVDILDAGSYTGWKLWKDDEVFQTGSITGTLLSFPDLDYGSYRLCLTQENEESECVYWIVVDNRESYTDLGKGALRCVCSSANAVPVSLNWNYNPEYEQSAHGKKIIEDAIFKTDRIDADKFGRGQVEVSYEPGTYDMRVAYKTEYGLFWSDIQTVTLTPPKRDISILTQPQNTIVAPGDTAIVTVEATGEGLTYQWYIKNSNQTRFYKSRVTSDTYSVTATAKMNGRQLYCVIRDASGATVTTDTVTLTVSP